MAVPETPITRLEQYWAAILDKIQGGGSSVTVEALNVTENDTYTAPTGKAYSPVMVAVPNPNNVVTVTGTLDAPFGDLDWATLKAGLLSLSLSLYMTIDASVLGVTDPVPLTCETPTCSFCIIDATGSDGAVTCVKVVYDETGELAVADYIDLGSYTNLTPYASSLPTTLTVIYHPLPTE